MTPAFFSAETRTYCFFFRKHGEKTIEIRNLLTCAFGKKKEQKYSRRRFLRQKSAASLTGREDFSVLSLCGVVPPPFPPPPDMHFTSFPMRQPMAQGKETKKSFLRLYFSRILLLELFPSSYRASPTMKLNLATQKSDPEILRRDSIDLPSPSISVFPVSVSKKSR